MSQIITERRLTTLFVVSFIMVMLILLIGPLPAMAQGPVGNPTDAVDKQNDDWKLYKDTASGIVLKYPSSWTMYPGEYIDSSWHFYEIRIQQPSETQDYSGITVLIEKNPQKLDVDAFTRQEVSRLTDEADETKIVTENVLVGGIPAVRVNHSSGAITSSTYILRGPFVYRFSLVGSCCGTDGKSDTAVILDKVLATVQFEDAATDFMVAPSEKTQSSPQVQPFRESSTAAATVFTYPVAGSRIAGYDYGERPNKDGAPPCYTPTTWRSLYHDGEDWMGASGTAVRAVADGTVEWYDARYDYPGRVVIIKHTLPDGSTIYSMYGHLTSVSVAQGQSVAKEANIGAMYNQSSNTHVHWEMRYFRDGSNLCSNPNSHPGVPGPGYSTVHPDQKGYTNPGAFVRSHSSAVPAAPSNLRATALSPNVVRLDWNDNSNNETSFEVYDGNTRIASVGANTPSYTVGGLAPNSYHCYHLYAHNGSGDSPWTDWACITTPSGGSSDPDDQRTLSAGQTLAGTINPADDQDIYYFDGNTSQSVFIRMNRTSGNLDSYLYLYAPNGNLVTQDDDSGGNTNSFINGFALPQNGRYRIVAQSYNRGSTGGYNLSLSMTSSTSGGPSGYAYCAQEGQRCNFSGTKDVAYGANGRFNYRTGVSGGIDCNNNVFGDPIPGTTKACYIKDSSSGSTVNLARGKASWATTSDRNFPYQYGNDGNTGTRWSSAGSGAQWFKIDLGSAQQFNQFVVRWETAYARTYYVAYCDNNCTVDGNSNWYGYQRTLTTRQDDVFNWSTQSHRYVGLYMVDVAPGYGNFSFWEFEVYNRVGANSAESIEKELKLPEPMKASEPVQLPADPSSTKP